MWSIKIKNPEKNRKKKPKFYRFSFCVMAFLRSIGRYNPLVSRKLLINEFNSTFSRDELLLRQRYYNELRRELHTKNPIVGSVAIAEHQKSINNGTNAMSTAAAAAAAVSASKSGTVTSTSRQPTQEPPQRDPLDTSFDDPIAAFKSKTTWELIRAYFVYLMCSSEYLVENNMKVKKTKKQIYDKSKYILSKFFACDIHI